MVDWNGMESRVKFNSGSNKVLLLSIIRPAHSIIGIQIITGSSGV